MVETGVTGAVVVASGPRGRVEAAAGVADVATGTPLTPEHRFRIGSVTKIFVAPLVLRLVEEGLLELDGDAAPFATGITIRQLLNHTSGLDDFMGDPIAFFEPYRRDPGRRWELAAQDELELVLAKPRLHPPGEGWAYHGSNYLVPVASSSRRRRARPSATRCENASWVRSASTGPISSRNRSLATARAAISRRTTRSCRAGPAPST